MEIQNKEYEVMCKFKNHIEKNEGYFLKSKYESNDKYLQIKKRKKLFKFFREFNWLCPITNSIFFYDDWIYIEVTPEFKNEIVKLVKGFDINIEIKIKIWGELKQEL